MSERSSELDRYVTATAAALRLPIPPESRPRVIENVARVLDAAALVLDFPLPDDLEAAPIFRP